MKVKAEKIAVPVMIGLRTKPYVVAMRAWRASRPDAPWTAFFHEHLVCPRNRSNPKKAA